MTETETIANAAKRIEAQAAERWPTLFNLYKPVPLAIGIYDALLEALPDATADQLRRMLGKWCNRLRYLAVLTADAERHALDGVQGVVTEEQAAIAAKRLETELVVVRARHKAKVAAKRKQEKAMKALAKRKAEQAKAKENAKAEKAKQAAPPEPAEAKPAAPAAEKPAGPTIIVKKRRFTVPPDLAKP